MGTRERTVAVLAVLVLVGVIVASTPRALWADSAILPGANIFGVNPNASGTKVSGPLAIFFEVIGFNTASCLSTHEVDMFIVMRLKLGTNTFAFAPAGPTPLCYENQSDIVTAVKNFVTSTVIPLMFPSPQCANPSTCWQLKDVANFHQDGEPEGNSCPINPGTGDCASFWAVMDVTLAVNP